MDLPFIKRRKMIKNKIKGKVKKYKNVTSE